MNDKSQQAFHFGLPSDVINRINEVFSREPKIDQVLIYGSRAKGNFKPGSDIDLTIKGPSMNLTDLLDHIQRRGQVFFSSK